MEIFPQVIVSAAIVSTALYLLWAVISRQVNPLALAVGADGRLSTSKFQFVIWTAAAVFTYIALAVAWRGHAPSTSSMPTYLLIAMGLSLTTAVGAKAIAVSYSQNAPVSTLASRRVAPCFDLRFLVCDDDGSPSLVKTQMLLWTIIAVSAYLLDFSSHFSSFVDCSGGAGCFPNIDPTLMVLMGLGNGAYIGNKMVPSMPAALLRGDMQRIGSVAKSSVTVQVYGTGLETADMTAGGLPIAVTWNSGIGAFVLPASLDDPGSAIAISAMVGGNVIGTISVVVPANLAI